MEWDDRINGVGTEIWKTTNGGSNWTSVWPDQDTKATFNLFLSAAATSTTSAGEHNTHNFVNICICIFKYDFKT